MGKLSLKNKNHKLVPTATINISIFLYQKLIVYLLGM
jgi:hypothetical protein